MACGMRGIPHLKLVGRRLSAAGRSEPGLRVFSCR